MKTNNKKPVSHGTHRFFVEYFNELVGARRNIINEASTAPTIR